MELQSRVNELQAQGLGLAVVTYDSREVLADFAARRAITYPLLSDPGSATIRGFGLLNTTIQPGTLAFGVPFPGTFVLDRRGRVTARFFETVYQERTTVSTILMKIGDTPERPATAAATAHLDLRAWAGDDTLAVGRHVSVVVDITPRPGMHVYAPGATNYKVVALTLAPPPGVRVLSSTYPPSETYHFAPLNEDAPVYTKAFRLTQEVVLDQRPSGAPPPGPDDVVVVSGRLDYQACDDTVCFNPVSIPLSWTFRQRDLDRERARPR